MARIFAGDLIDFFEDTQARSVMSSRLPMGVPTRYRHPPAAGSAGSTGLEEEGFAVMQTSLARGQCVRRKRQAGATEESSKNGSEDPPLRGGQSHSRARAMLYFQF